MYKKTGNNEFAAIFDKIAPRYDKILNRYALSRRIEFISRYAFGKCLEVGAGAGLIAQALQQNHRVVATDISPQMVKQIKKKNIKARVGDAENLPFAAGVFDTVVAGEMIYYLNRPQRFIREAKRVLKPGGRLIITSAAKITEIYNTFRSCLRHLGFSAMYFDDKNRQFISKNKLEELLFSHAFQTKRLEKAVILPWSVFDPLNRFLEKTPLIRNLAGFIYILAQKPRERLKAKCPQGPSPLL